MKTIYFLFLAYVVLSGSAWGNVPPDFKQHMQYALSFTENKGQFADQNSNPRPDVLFGGSNGQFAFHITSKGISYQLYRVDKYKEIEHAQTKENIKEVNQQTIYRADIRWLNANPNPGIKSDEVLPGYMNYYLEQCPNGALNVKSYKGITLQNIYRNIDLHYYEKEGQLKYDYVVAPYGDYKQIRMKVEGAKLHLQADGSLIIETPLGKIQEEAPLVYQNGKQLNARYNIMNNVISFVVEDASPDYELIIDPLIRMWGTYYGGPLVDYGVSCATDASDNVFMMGWANASTGTVVATSGAHQVVFGGGSVDVFLVKFNGSGVRQWGTYYGGTGLDLGGSCATDASGNIYVTGSTESSSGTVMATSGSHQSVFGGGDDAFLVKFNSSGVRQWATYYGGAGTETGNSCATDASGNVYMSGYADGGAGTLIATSGCHQGTYGGGSYDAFLVKFSSSGVRQWATYYGSTGRDGGYFCTTDASGNVYMLGETDLGAGTAIATTGSHQTTLGGFIDAYLVKFSSSGVRQWGTYYGGTANDYGYSCAIDAFGNVYMSGGTNSGTGTVIATTGSHQSNWGGNTDAYLVKFSSSGVRQWGTYYGGTGSDQGSSCILDAAANVYMVGGTGSNTGTTMATSASYQNIYGGASSDAFLVKFNSSGIRSFGTYYGGAGNDGGRFCTRDGSGNIYMTGSTSTSSGTAIATAGSHQSTIGGNMNAFLVKFADCNTVAQPSAISGSPTVCASSAQTYSVANDPAATSYSWSLPAGWNGTSISHTIAATAGISGIFTVVANSTCMASPPRTLQVTVNPSPTVSVNSGSICVGDSFTISPSGASTYTIQGGNPVVSPTATAFYTVAGASAFGCMAASSATSGVVVKPLPTISGSSSSTLICVGESATLTAGGAVSYTWNPGSAGASIVVAPSVSTTYTISGTDSNGCVNTGLFTQHVSFCAGIAWLEANGSMPVVFPNPTNGKFTISSQGLKQVLVYNSMGQLIYSLEMKEEIMEVDLSEEANGIYVVKVGPVFKKVVKE